MATVDEKGGVSLRELDPNLVACVLLHLQPADLARVRTCPLRFSYACVD
jgi:hypothetical protein